MTKKNILFLLIAFLAVAYIYWQLYKDSFKGPSIHISHTVRPRRFDPRRPKPTVLDAENSTSVNFGLGGAFKLTDIRVISETALATNSTAQPIWHLISESNSVPVRAFVYGQGIRGMHPYIKDAVVPPLEDGVTYRILIQAGHIKGEHQFKMGAEAIPQTTNESAG